MIDIELG